MNENKLFSQQKEDPTGVWLDKKARAERKGSEPTYPREDVSAYIPQLDEFVRKYNKNSRKAWKIALAFVFGSALNSEAESVHDLDICISVLPKNSSVPCLGTAHKKEFTSITRRLQKICPMIEVHDWSYIASLCNDFQLIENVKQVGKDSNGAQPYVLYGPRKLIGNTSFSTTMSHPTILVIRRIIDDEMNAAHIEFLVTFKLFSLVSVYRGRYWLYDNREKSSKVSCEKVTGLDLFALHGRDNLIRALCDYFEQTYPELIEQIQDCIDNRTELSSEIYEFLV